MQRWEVRDLGDVTEFLHMRIIKIGRMININQCDYLNTVDLLPFWGVLEQRSLLPTPNQLTPFAIHPLPVATCP